MPGLFRTSSERLVVSLVRTPFRRHALAGVALLALTTLRPSRPGDEGSGRTAVVADAASRPAAAARRPPADPREPLARPVGVAPVARVFSHRDRRVFGWILLVSFVLIALVGTLGEARPLVALGVVGTVLTMCVVAPEATIAFFLLSGSIKAAPWLPAIPIDVTFASWLAMLFAMLLVALRGGIPRPPRTAMLALGLTALVIASYWWSRNAAEGWTKALTFELLAMSGFVAPLLLVRDRAAMTRLMIALLASGLLIAFTTVATKSAAEPLVAAGGNEIAAALHPAIALIAGIGYLALLPGLRWRLLGFLPVLILLPAVVAAGSRGVLVAGAVALAFVIVRHITRAKNPWLAAALVAVSLLVIVQLSASLAGGAAAKYESSLLSTNSSQVLGGRAELYDRGMELALHNSLTGAGVGAFPTTSIIFEPLLYPHNILLELAGEEGFTAVLILALLIAAAWWARRRAPGGVRSPEAIVAGALILFGLTEAFFSFDIAGNRIIWFALGLAFALPQLRPGRSLSAGTGR